MHFLVSLKDLEDIDGRVLGGGSDDEVVQRLRHVYEFLPVEMIISIADGIVSIDIPERVISNKLEAIRLQEKHRSEPSPASTPRRSAFGNVFWNSKTEFKGPGTHFQKSAPSLPFQPLSS